MRLLEQVTVAPTASERSQGRLGRASLQKAVQALREHGLCILRACIEPQSVRDVADHGRNDLECIEERLVRRCVVWTVSLYCACDVRHNFVVNCLRLLGELMCAIPHEAPPSTTISKSWLCANHVAVMSIDRHNFWQPMQRCAR